MTLPHAHHPSHQVSLRKVQAKFILQHILSYEDQQTMFQAKMSPQRHLQPYETPTLYPATCPLQQVPT